MGVLIFIDYVRNCGRKNEVMALSFSVRESFYINFYDIFFFLVVFENLFRK